MGYYVVKFISVTVTLQEYNTKYGKVSKSDELLFTAEYMQKYLHHT